jgi:hypothetical protein
MYFKHFCPHLQNINLSDLIGIALGAPVWAGNRSSFAVPSPKNILRECGRW